MARSDCDCCGKGVVGHVSVHVRMRAHLPLGTRGALHAIFTPRVRTSWAGGSLGMPRDQTPSKEAEGSGCPRGREEGHRMPKGLISRPNDTDSRSLALG